jgi:acetylornithine deacetylase/succinyl-diaminopimelate desuccinylase-like protein
MTTPAVAYARQNHPRFLHELKALLRIPSVSTLPEHKGDCHFAAEVLAADLSKIGMENVRLIETSTEDRADGAPAGVCGLAARSGQADRAGATGTTMCSRPSRWTSGSRPPFEPEERNGNLYARGAVDDKGQMWIAQVKALESAAEAATGKPPLQCASVLCGRRRRGGRRRELRAYVARAMPDVT